MPHLVILPLISLDAHHVLRDPLNRDDLFLVREELGLVGRLGHEEQPGEAHDQTEEAEDQEDVHPGLEYRVRDMAEPVRHKTRDDGESALHSRPQHGPHHLLTSSVPHGSVDDEAGGDNAFSDSKEETDDHQAGEITQAEMTTSKLDFPLKLV